MTLFALMVNQSITEPCLYCMDTKVFTIHAAEGVGSPQWPHSVTHFNFSLWLLLKLEFIFKLKCQIIRFIENRLIKKYFI